MSTKMFVLYVATDTGSAALYAEGDNMHEIKPSQKLMKRLADWIGKSYDKAEISLLPGGWYAFIHRESFPAWIMAIEKLGNEAHNGK